MPSAVRNHALVYINGVRHEIGAEHAGWMLADYLRYQRQLTGTKLVCAEGDCGACTVLRYFPGLKAGGVYVGRSRGYQPVNSCILTMAQLDGSSLVTVEALAKGSELSPVQNAMKDCHGSQCGFCTPGFVMALAGLVEKKIEEKSCRKGEFLEDREAKNALTGNLCRCTGYQPILDAARAIEPASCESVKKRYHSAAREKELQGALAKALSIESDSFSVFAPRTLREGAAYLAKNPEARIVAAATDLGVIHNKGKITLTRILSLHLIPELYQLTVGKKGEARVGARVTLSELRRAFKERAPELARFLDLFASPQIKNVATLVGNVANASPIADAPPFLLACEAVLELVGPKGKREVPLSDFYLAYRKTALRKGEILAFIRFQLPAAGDSLAIYKVSERKDLDISAVNAGFHLQWGKAGAIAGARLALGGVGPTPQRLVKTEALLRGQAISAALVERAAAQLQAEIQPISDVRGSGAYRRVVAENLLRKFFRELSR